MEVSSVDPPLWVPVYPLQCLLPLPIPNSINQTKRRCRAFSEDPHFHLSGWSSQTRCKFTCFQGCGLLGSWLLEANRKCFRFFIQNFNTTWNNRSSGWISHCNNVIYSHTSGLSCQLLDPSLYEGTCWAVFGRHHLIPVQPAICLRLFNARKALMSWWYSFVFSTLIYSTRCENWTMGNLFLSQWQLVRMKMWKVGSTDGEVVNWSHTAYNAPNNVRFSQRPPGMQRNFRTEKRACRSKVFV